MNIRLASALSLFEDGYAIFPIAEDSKVPVVKWTSEWATDRDQVVDYWTTCPGDNIGINCKESALLVVDLDGKEGIRNFQQLWSEHGTGDYQDYTRWSITPSGGRHVWFEMSYNPLALRNTTSGLARCVDTRGDGGMIVAPGSEIDGRCYRLINPQLPAPLPAWLEKQLRALEPDLMTQLMWKNAPPVVWPDAMARFMLAEVPLRVAATHPGHRNKVLNREAWRMRAAVPTLGLEAVQEHLLAAAEQNGLPEYEARRTIQSGLGC